MKRVPLKQLKQNLSKWVEQAHKGETVEVTKYNQPYVHLQPAQEQGLYMGIKVGQFNSQPLFKNATKGAFLKTLLEDREDG